MNLLTNISQTFDTVSVMQDIHTVLQEYYKIKWWQQVSRTEAARGTGQNKLRTYSKFKTSMTAESYIKVILPKGHRSSLAKFRCWVAPIRIETGRYENVNEFPYYVITMPLKMKNM